MVAGLCYQRGSASYWRPIRWGWSAGFGALRVLIRWLSYPGFLSGAPPTLQTWKPSCLDRRHLDSTLGFGDTTPKSHASTQHVHDPETCEAKPGDSGYAEAEHWREMTINGRNLIPRMRAQEHAVGREGHERPRNDVGDVMLFSK